MKYFYLLILILLLTGVSAKSLDWKISSDKEIEGCNELNCANPCFSEIETDAGIYQTGGFDDDEIVRQYTVKPGETWTSISCLRDLKLDSSSFDIKENQSIELKYSYMNAPGLELKAILNGKEIKLNKELSTTNCQDIKRISDKIIIDKKDLIGNSLTLSFKDTDTNCDFASMIWLGSYNVIKTPQPSCDDLNRGKIIESNGRVFIFRGVNTISASSELILQTEDVIAVEDESSATINLDSKNIQISEKTKFEIPKCKVEKKPSIVSKIFSPINSLWNKLKGIFKGEDFEIETPTAVAGVRG